MTGRVEQLHALVPVLFRLPGQADVTVEFVVDTGFTGFLTLPLRAVEAMRLPYLQDISASLADDSYVPLPVHLATIVWHGREQNVRVIATGRRPLLGTGLLDGSELVVQFSDQGRLSVEPLM